MPSVPNNERNSRERRSFDRYYGKLYRQVLSIRLRPSVNNERNDRRSHRRTAFEIMQARLEDMANSRPNSSRQNGTSSTDPSGRPSNVPSSSNEHTEEIYNAATIEDNTVIISDSDNNSEEGSIRKSNNKDFKRNKNMSKNRAKKINGKPSTSTTKLDIKVNGSILKLNNGHNLSKPKKIRKNKNLQSSVTYTISNGNAINYPLPQSNEERKKKKKRKRSSKKTRLLTKMRTRTQAIQFVTSDVENDETKQNESRIEFSENELTFTHSTTTQNTQNKETGVNCEVVSEPSPSSSHTNPADKSGSSKHNQSIIFDNMATTPNDHMNFSRVAGYETLDNRGRSANQYDEEDRISVGDYSMISGDDFSESKSHASDGFRQFDEVHEYRNYENRREGEQNYYYAHRGEVNGSEHVSGYYADEDYEYPNYENMHEGDQNYYDRHRAEANGSEHDGGYHEDEAYGNSENRHDGGENTDYANRYYGHEVDYTSADESEHLDYDPSIGSQIFIDPSGPESCDPNSPSILDDAHSAIPVEDGNDFRWSPGPDEPREPFRFGTRTSNSPTPDSVHGHGDEQPVISSDAEQSCSISPANESANLSLQERRPSNESIASDPLSKSTQFFTSPCGKVLLLLKSKLCFHGSLKIRLLAGRASIFGYKLQQNQEVTANSFPAHGVLYLCPESSPQRFVGIDENMKELSEYFTNSDIHKIKTEFDSSTDAIVELKTEYRNKSIAMIEKYMEEDQDITTNVNALDNCSQTESALHCNFLQHTETGLQVNPQWEEILMSMDSRQVLIGGKVVGSSTVLRYLINKNLTEFPKILLIDLDIDRPEIFVPKAISATIITNPLLGPGFLRSFSPIKSYLFNDTTISSPMKYLQCVHKLLKYCRSVKGLTTMPWIVITRGYINRVDFELTIAIIRAVNPTNLIQIHGRDSIEFEMNLTADRVNNYRFELINGEVDTEQQKCSYQVHNIDTVLHVDQVNLWNSSTVNLQLAICLARLAHKLPWNANLIDIKPPVCAPLNSLKILVDDDSVAPHFLPNAINGNMCYLCQSMNDQMIECYGIGFVRALDVAAGNVYLLPSIDNTELENVNTLAVCGVPVPKFMLIDLPPTNINVPYMYRD